MRALSRVAAVLAVAAASIVVVGPVAEASPVDCQYTKAKKLVTLTVENTDPTGWLVVVRELGSPRIGYEVDGGEWKRCGDARVTNTNKVKIVGSTLSDELAISLENGAFAPGASRERSGVAEIEFQVDLQAGTDELWLSGGDGPNALGLLSRTSAALNGDSDVDVQVKGADNWTLVGGDGNDRLDGHGVPQVNLVGGEGADRLIGGPGDDDLRGDDSGQPGDDDVLIGNGGDDDMAGYLGNDTLLGGDGDDWMAGHEGRDTLRGGPGDDGLVAMSVKDGADLVDGGPGTDRAYYHDRTGSVKISLDNRSNDGARKEGDDVRSSVENVSAGSGNDTLVGSNGYNNLEGGEGNDVIRGLDFDDDLDGGEGNDSLYGGPGDEWFGNDEGSDKYLGDAGDDAFDAGDTNDGRDVFSGGVGYDRVYYDGRSSAVTMDTSTPGDDGEVGENDDVRADLEFFVGGTGSDLIVGTGVANYISGGSGSGADTLRGAGGADDINGYDGNDTLVGGEGYDDMDGGGGDDQFNAADQGEDYLNGSSGTDTVLDWDALLDYATSCEVLPV